jgi:hypothetical protein
MTMDAYIYRGALLCEECAIATGRVNEGEDSEQNPIGPYDDGGGEADSPQHCAQCFVFLENPLTDDGCAYVRKEIAAGLRGLGAGRLSDSMVLDEWMPFYGLQPA